MEQQSEESTSAEDLESSQGFVMRTVDNDGQPGKLATFNTFGRGFLSGELKLTVLNNTIFVGCVTDTSFSEDKAQRFLSEIRSEFSKMYQGRLSLIKK